MEAQGRVQQGYLTYLQFSTDIRTTCSPWQNPHGIFLLAFGLLQKISSVDPKCICQKKKKTTVMLKESTTTVA